MGSQIPNGNDRSRTYWTPTMERYFVDLMLEHMQKGNRVGYTFNKQAWNDMLAVFNAKFGSQYDKDVLKSRYTNLWKQFNDIKHMLGQGGFTWDETQHMVVAENHHVWDAYIKDHPDARIYKTKSVQSFSELCLIYGYTTADGRYSRSSHDMDVDDEVNGVNSGDGLGTPTPSTTDRLRTEWTLDMDQFFTELLLGQQAKGNKHDSNSNSYTKAAWTEMLSSFNERFGPHHTKRVLRHRYKKLFKYYTDITVLLKHDGFSWDAKQNKVVANDDTWDTYIKAHPQSRSYRTKCVPNYKDLESVFGSAVINNSQSNNLDEDIGAKTGSERSRTHWTPPMDCYFINLLLEQVNRGNSNGQTFMAQAWISMLKSFNDNFGSNHDKDVLKNRYKHLKKQYNDITTLLWEKGFSWDDAREMVTAEDDVWDAYIEAHPDARSYRVKTVSNYCKLCIIYGQNNPEGRDTKLAHTVIVSNTVNSENRNPESPQILPKETGAISKKKRVKKTQLDLGRSVKAQKNQSDDMKEVFTDMANVVSKLVNGKTDKDHSAIEKALETLQAIPDIDDLLLDGCDILEDEKKAKTFLALDDSLRKKWLLRKLGR